MTRQGIPGDMPKSPPPGKRKKRQSAGGKGRPRLSGPGSPGRDPEILFGVHPVREALKSGQRRIKTLLVSRSRDSRRISEILDLADQNHIPVQTLAPEKLDTLCRNGLHQGVALRAGPIPVQPASRVISLVRQQEKPAFILVLESIEDPHNLGALIRTALCCGVDFILIPKDRCAEPTATVSRCSAGAMEHAALFTITNTAAILRDLKKEGAWVYGLDAAGDKRLDQADLTGPVVLVVGGEHRGIRPGVKKECDFLLAIPNQGAVTSLNASVAGGMAMYEALCQRVSEPK